MEKDAEYPDTSTVRADMSGRIETDAAPGAEITVFPGESETAPGTLLLQEESGQVFRKRT